MWFLRMSAISFLYYVQLVLTTAVAIYIARSRNVTEEPEFYLLSVFGPIPLAAVVFIVLVVQAILLKREPAPHVVRYCVAAGLIFPSAFGFATRPRISHMLLNFLPPRTLTIDSYLTLAFWAVVMLQVPLAIILMRPKVWPLGICRVCGYDLRASNVRCPECGTPIHNK